MEADAYVWSFWLDALLCAAIAGAIGSRKGWTWNCAVAGFLFGPFGIVAAVMVKGNRVACPSCKELINHEATRCPRCQQEVTPQPIPPTKTSIVRIGAGVLAVILAFFLFSLVMTYAR